MNTVGPLCYIAIGLCRNWLFQEFAVSTKRPAYYVKFREKFAKQYLLDECGIGSRKELDADRIAAKKFADLRTRFASWRLEYRARVQEQLQQ